MKWYVMILSCVMKFLSTELVSKRVRRELDFIPNYVNPESTTMCPKLTDCLSCSSYIVDQVNCEWDIEKGCVASFELNPNRSWWRYFSDCSLDPTSYSRMKNYCGSVGKTTIFSNLNFTLPVVSNLYSTPTLYCKWDFVNSQPDEYILLEYYKNIRNGRLILSINGEYQNKKTFNYDIDNDIFIFNAQGVTNFTVHYFSIDEFRSPPFLLKMSYQKISSNLSSIFLSVGLILIMILIFVVVLCRCYYVFKNRQLEIERIRIRSQMNIIDLNNMNNQQSNEEAILMDKNRQEIERLLSNEYKQIPYQDNINEFKDPCTICFDNFNDQCLVSVLPCKHIFHHTCLKNWLMLKLLTPECPNCKLNLLKVTS